MTVRSNRATFVSSPLLGMALVSALALGCGTSSSIDATTASFASSLGASCASGHDCGSNQRCVANRCELRPNACLAQDQCGSQRCDAGFCALPSPAQLVDESKNKKPSPRNYLKAGNDGLVDGRGGLVLALGENLIRDGERLRWHDFLLDDWVARDAAPKSWAPTNPDPASAPERFVFRNPTSGATLVAYARPVAESEMQMVDDPLTSHAGRLGAALERGHDLGDAITLDPKTLEAYPLQNQRWDETRVDAIRTVQMDAQRVIAGDAQKLRVHVGRVDFGNRSFVLYVGLSAPSTEYAQSLDELAEFVEDIKVGGVDAGLPTGVTP